MADESVASPEPLIDVDPPVSPAPAADDQKATPAATDANAEAAVETPEQAEAKKQSRTQRRFERQKTARIQAETRAQMLEQQLAELKGRQQQQPESREPIRENYPDIPYEEFLDIRQDWRADQREKAREAEREVASQRKEQQGRAQQGMAKSAQGWIEREKAFQAVTKDYEEVAHAFLEDDAFGRLADVTRHAIVDSEVGPQVLYHLAQNPDVAERIAELPAHRQAVELGKLEAKVTTPGKKASDAPPPVKPVSQGRSAPNGYSENMTPAEYRAWRKGHGANWAH